MKFIVYQESTGRIMRSGFCQESDFDLQIIHEDEAVLEASCDLNNDYILNAAVTARPTSGLVDVTLAVDEDLVKPDLPVGTVILIDEIEVSTLTEPGLEIAFPTPGIWKLSVECPFPWINSSCEVTVL
jgi:hypothetical protein